MAQCCYFACPCLVDVGMFVSDVDIVEGLAFTVNMVRLGDAVVTVVAA